MFMKSLFVLSFYFLSAGANTQSVNANKKQSQQKRAKRKISSYKKPTLEEISNHSTALIVSGKLDISSKDLITGSGFFIGKSILVTNNHVVEKNDTIFLKTPDGKVDVGMVVLRDPVNDLAIVKTLKSNYKPIKFGNYSKVKLGDKISVISSPQGLVGTLSQGIVSSKRKLDNKNFLQITAPISSGSSGSPVLNEKLKLIGISVFVMKQSQNINFAIPATYLQSLITKNKKKLVKLNKMNVKKEFEKQNQKLKTLAKKGDLKSQRELAHYYYQNKQYKKAFYWFKKAALQGDAESQYNTGAMHYSGQGVTQNKKQAFHWFEKAALQDYAIAQFNLGVMYNEGQEVVKDYSQALYWYKKAALQDYADAQINIGTMHEKGQGVIKDYSQAFYWFKKAALQGNAIAQYNVGLIYSKGQEVVKDYAKAFHWFEKAALQGDAIAQFKIGLMYYSGQGVVKDDTQSIYWMKKSEKNGYSTAKNFLRDLAATKIQYQYN